MDVQHGHDLGLGVWVVSGFDGGWQVRSHRLRLPWAERSGCVPGSAVVWLDEPFEVIAVSRTPSGERWDLRPWPENEVMRGVFRLGESSIETLAGERLEGRTRRFQFWLTVPLLPVLGLLPGKMQSRWHRDWGFPAAMATLLSAVVELAVAALGVIHLLAQGIGGVSFLPPALSWLGLVSPVLFIESVVRLKHFGAHQEPIGSAVSLPLALLERSEPEQDRLDQPEVRRVDPATGKLELWSPVHRADWTLDGVLRFRDRLYMIEKLEASGGGWLYHFTRAQPDGKAARLRLAPRPQGPVQTLSVGPGAGPDRGPGVVATAGLTALACMAPGDIQERWASWINVRPSVLTLAGAGAEIVGGLTNIGTGQFDGGPWWLMLDLFFVAEGMVRCILLVLSGGPVGSVLGLILRPLLEAWMPDGESG